MSMSLTLKLSGGKKKKEVVGVRVDNNEWAEILRELQPYSDYHENHSLHSTHESLLHKTKLNIGRVIIN